MIVHKDLLDFDIAALTNWDAGKTVYYTSPEGEGLAITLLQDDHVMLTKMRDNVKSTTYAGTASNNIWYL